MHASAKQNQWLFRFFIASTPLLVIPSVRLHAVYELSWRRSLLEINAMVCTSCGNAKVAGPQVIDPTWYNGRWQNLVIQSCFWAIKYDKITRPGRKQSFTDIVRIVKTASKLAVNTGSGVRVANTSPVKTTQASRWPWPNPPAVIMLVAPGQWTMYSHNTLTRCCFA